MRFSSRIEAAGGLRGTREEEKKKMKGKKRELAEQRCLPGCGKATGLPPCTERWECFARSPPPASKGRCGEAPAPLGPSGFYSNSLLKVICGSLATPHPRKSFAAQQLAPVDSLLHWNRLYLGAWQEPSQRDSPSPAGAVPAPCLRCGSYQTQRQRLARPRTCERLSTPNSC